MRNSKYGTTVQKYSNLHVKYENNDYNRHFCQSAAVNRPPSVFRLKTSIFRLKTGVFNLPKAKKNDYFHENNRETRKGTTVAIFEYTEYIV